MVRIPYIKIPSVRVGSIAPASDIGVGGAIPAPPTPIIYLTQWKMMGNSTVHTDEYLTQWKVSGNSVVDNPSADLPQGYKKCKYLESHGTEYIELPFGFDTTDEVSAKAALVDLIRIHDMFFVAPKTWNSDNNRFGLGCHNNFGVAYGSKSTSLTTFRPLKEADVDVHTYSYANELFTFDEGVGSRDVSDITFGSTTDNLKLFHTYHADVKCRIYAYHHVKANDVEVNLIPCLDDNNVPCLYDTVSNTAFYNDGTGTFGYELEQPAILSCGDYSDVDGKYHVKISNGVSIYDIPLTEPLRKVGDIADTIEFVNGVATLTRNFASAIMSGMKWYFVNISSTDKYRYCSADLRDKMKVFLNNQYAVMLCPIYDVHLVSPVYMGNEIGIAANSNGIYLYDDNYDSVDDLTAFLAHINGVELIYELATPTTEVIQASPFPISPTDTYTSVNDTPYSAFEYKKNVEIWSCGEYSAVDGKYHILVQPLGGSIADIALDEPLRKVNNVADKIEFVNGVATVTRNLAATKISDNTWRMGGNIESGNYGFCFDAENKKSGYNIMCGGYNTLDTSFAWTSPDMSIGASVMNNRISIKDLRYFTVAELLQGQGDNVILYELATPTTEVIQVPQIEEAESYSCVISQGAKAVSWSSFETEINSN